MANLESVIKYVMVLVIAGVFLGVGLTVLSSLADSTATSGTAETAVNNTVTAIAAIPSTWLPIIVIVAMAAIILFMITRFGGK